MSKSLAHLEFHKGIISEETWVDRELFGCFKMRTFLIAEADIIKLRLHIIFGH